MPYILLTQLDDKPVLVNTDSFLFFAGYKSNVKEGNVSHIVDCTNCVLNEEMGLLVKESPQDILEAIDYANIEGEYEGRESGDEGWESDEADDGEKVCNVSASPS